MQTASNDANIWSPYFAAYGNPLIVWGTEGILGSYIVTTASSSQRFEEINIAQGAGFTAILILLMDGITVDIEVVDDTTIIPPSFGTVATLVTPFGSMPMALTKNDANQARKREGMRSFTFKSFVAISGLH
jgi:hypothetical protein